DQTSNQKYGHRCMQVTRNYPDSDTYVLVEGNRIGFASVNPNNDGADNLDIAAASVIARYNFIYGAMNSGVMFKYGYSRNGKVYNNTLFHNGFGYDYYYNGGSPCPSRGKVCPGGTAAITVYDNAVRPGSVVVNNLIYQSGADSNFGRAITTKTLG